MTPAVLIKRNSTQVVLHADDLFTKILKIRVDMKKTGIHSCHDHREQRGRKGGSEAKDSV